MKTILIVLAAFGPILAKAECAAHQYDHAKIEARLESLLGIQKNLSAMRRGLNAFSESTAESTAIVLAEQLVSRSVDHGLYLRPYWAIYSNESASTEVRQQIDQIVELIVANSRSTASMAADFLSNMITIVPRVSELESARDGLRRWEASLYCVSNSQ